MCYHGPTEFSWDGSMPVQCIEGLLFIRSVGSNRWTSAYVWTEGGSTYIRPSDAASYTSPVLLATFWATEPDWEWRNLVAFDTAPRGVETNQYTGPQAPPDSDRKWLTASGVMSAGGELRSLVGGDARPGIGLDVRGWMRDASVLDGSMAGIADFEVGSHAELGLTGSMTGSAGIGIWGDGGMVKLKTRTPLRVTGSGTLSSV